MQVDQRRAVPGARHDERSGEHPQQERRGESQDRATGRLLLSYLVHRLEPFQVSLNSAISYMSSIIIIIIITLFT